jgi:hypothetical protein
MAFRRTRPRSLARRSARRPELKTFVIFCEGKTSEPDYINGLKRLRHVRDRASINIEIDPRHGDPLILVRRAIERSKDAEVDQCWCVFDVEWPDNHPQLGRAVQLAERNGIQTAVSNPCFELWLILHFQDQTACLTTAEAERVSRGLDGRPGKAIDPGVYLDHRQAAARRARQGADRHARNLTLFPDDNPSSTMYKLLAAIEPSRP